MIAILILLIVLSLIILCFYFDKRNDEVYYFSISLSNLLDELRRILNTYKDDDEFHEDENNYNYIKEKVQALLNKHSYNKYLFSFKSLKLEKWFTREELEFITYLKQYRNEMSNL